MTTLETLEKEHIARVIRQSATMEEAAQVLGIDPATLYRKRKKMALDPVNQGSPASAMA